MLRLSIALTRSFQCEIYIVTFLDDPSYPILLTTGNFFFFFFWFIAHRNQTVRSTSEEIESVSVMNNTYYTYVHKSTNQQELI